MTPRKNAAKEFMKIMDETKPNSAARELYICEESGSNRAIIRHAGEVLNDEVSSNIWTHFIEYSAFLKQQKIIEVLRDALEFWLRSDKCNDTSCPFPTRMVCNKSEHKYARIAIAESDRIKETE